MIVVVVVVVVVVIVVVVTTYNAILLHDSFAGTEDPNLHTFRDTCNFSCFNYWNLLFQCTLS